MSRSTAAALAVLTIFAMAGCSRIRSAPAASPGLGDPHGIGAFARYNEVTGVKISPLGSHLAVATVDGPDTALAFLRVKDLKPAGGMRFKKGETLLRFEWASDDTVVIELAPQDGPLGRQESLGEIVAVKVDSTVNHLVFGKRAEVDGRRYSSYSSRMALPGRSGGAALREYDIPGGNLVPISTPIGPLGRLIDPLPQDDDAILVASERWPEGPGQRRVVELYEVDDATGRGKVIAGGDDLPSWVFTDHGGALHFGLKYSQQSGWVALEWVDDEWRERAAAQISSHQVEPRSYAAAKRAIFFEDEDANGPGLFRMVLHSGERTLVSRQEGLEARSILFDPETGEPLAIAYEDEHPRWKMLDEKSIPVGLLAIAELKLPKFFVDVTSVTLDGRHMVVHATSDKDPGGYYLVSDDKKSLRPIVERRSGIDTKKTGATEIVEILTGDGVVLKGYLTLPDGEEPSNLPLVLLIHDGPFRTRDRWGFDPEVQLFAHRGMAVLQVNYRGSGGRGFSFESAAHRRWADRVPEDLIEAVRFAVERGVADPSRVSAFGSGFGAYLAMQAAIKSPETFRCVVGQAGIYDPLFFLPAESRLAGRPQPDAELIAAAFGKDEEEVARWSLLPGLPALGAAVLLIHGEFDRRAPFAQAEAFASALKDNKKIVLLQKIDGEGHGFYSTAARLDAYTRALDFMFGNTLPERE